MAEETPVAEVFPLLWTKDVGGARRLGNNNSWLD